MALTQAQQEAVQTTFATLCEDSDTFAATFYLHFFALNPSLQRLFTTDMKTQGDTIVRMLTVVVNGLDYMDDLLPALHDMGLHHKGYGVKTEDYRTFNSALNAALAELLGEQYTADVAEAWNAFFALLSTAALEGATE